MKRGGRHASKEDRLIVLARDGDRCVLCGAPGQDFDHGFRLSSYLPRINEAWALNLLCRRCHTHVTLPDTREKWLKALKVIELALHRAYDELGEREYKPHYAYYKSKLAKFKQLYGDV